MSYRAISLEKSHQPDDIKQIWTKFYSLHGLDTASSKFLEKEPSGKTIEARNEFIRYISILEIIYCMRSHPSALPKRNVSEQYDSFLQECSVEEMKLMASLCTAYPLFVKHVEKHLLHLALGQDLEQKDARKRGKI